jgi:hypothetical protein
MDPQGLFEEGRRAAAAGGQHLDCPCRFGYDGWVFMAWFRGFLAGRTPDPACPRCCGKGRVVVEPPGPDQYGGEFDCPCNVGRSNAEPGAAPDPALM